MRHFQTFNKDSNVNITVVNKWTWWYDGINYYYIPKEQDEVVSMYFICESKNIFLQATFGWKNKTNL